MAWLAVMVSRSHCSRVLPSVKAASVPSRLARSVQMSYTLRHSYSGVIAWLDTMPYAIGPPFSPGWMSSSSAAEVPGRR